MENSTDSLRRGLVEACKESLESTEISDEFQLDFLAYYVGKLIEGDTHRKKIARAHLKKIIGRGRCLLNAEKAALRAQVE
jgi:hypothetical protein